MASIATEPMTAEQFFEWANRPENDGTRYELENGEVVEMPSPGEIHGYICWLVTKLLTEYIVRRGSGYLLTNDAGLVVRKSPDTVRGPDVMLFLENRSISDLNAGPSDRVPALVVEVRSPSDRDGRILRRVEQYHRRGVPLVWVVDFEERLLTAYKPAEFPKVLDEAESVTGNGVLPDFECKVAELFALPGAAPERN